MAGGNTIDSPSWLEKVVRVFVGEVSIMRTFGVGSIRMFSGGMGAEEERVRHFSVMARVFRGHPENTESRQFLWMVILQSTQRKDAREKGLQILLLQQSHGRGFLHENDRKLWT